MAAEIQDIAATEVVTSKMEAEDRKIANDIRRQEEKRLKKLHATEFDAQMAEQKFQRLNFLLTKTELYSNFLADKMKSAADEAAAPTKKKRKGTDDAGSPPTKKQRTKNGASVPTRKDLKFFTGGNLRPYQLRGFDWLVSLYENGLNGILADEMGLGKTVQTIAFLAHLWEMGVTGPFLVIGPLSTLGNWVKELARFAPDIPHVLYHGSKEERAKLRRTKMKRTHVQYPVVVTSYEIAMRDCKYLKDTTWKLIIVDEGHRLKNFKCRLMMELKTYHSVNRLLLTGTPLQNNLTELWSLLNFLMPDIFNDVDQFKDWFDFAEEGEDAVAKQREDQVVTKLHQILRPFLLRRLKSDVENKLPGKKEVLLYTGKSPQQQELYAAALSKELRAVLQAKAQANPSMSGRIVDPLTGGTVRLLNIVMQLRKCCNHPYLFDYPLDMLGQFKVDEGLVDVSAKMQLLDRLLPKLRADGHKVLVFSQMTKMLDILEDYMGYRGHKYCRLDGATHFTIREEQIERFNNDPDTFVFLLSTRAGGLGINLVGGDTVIIYDSDWNPQVDIQAQDRCHRIGQTKDVVVYRLVTANSVESQILKRANEKRKLERLVVHKKQFKGDFTGGAKETKLKVGEMASLLKDDPGADGTGEIQNDISDETLDLLADRKRVFALPDGLGNGYYVCDSDNAQEGLNATLASFS